MEQVQQFLAIMKKHHFWVLTGAVLLVSLISWYLGQSKVNAEYKSHKSEVEQKFKTLDDVKNNPEQANASFKTEAEKIHDILKQHTLAAWTLFYDSQKIILPWPDLGGGFKQKLESLDRQAEIPDKEKRIYRGYARDRVERVLELVEPDLDKYKPVVHVRRLVEIPAPKSADGKEGKAVALQEWQGLVYWPESARNDFVSQFRWEHDPTTLQVRYAQEDLWVLESLLNVIGKTNLDADGNPVKEHVLAAVKRIDALEMGKYVSVSLLSGSAGGDQGGMGGMGGMPGGGGAGGPGAGGPGAGGPGAGGAGGPSAGGPGGGATGGMGGGQNADADPNAQIDAELKENRFVDAKGKPLGASEKAPFAEFNMMPVRLKLLVDQDKIPHLLANCANSPLTIEVRRVQINPEGGGAGGGKGNSRAPSGMGGMRGGAGGMGGGGMGGGGMGGGGMGGGGLDGMGPGGGGAGGGMGAGGGGRGPGMGQSGGGMGAGGGGNRNGSGGAINAEVESRSSDVEVEILGVVYLFNPPDKATLASGAGMAAPAEAPAGTVQGQPAPANPPADAASSAAAAGNTGSPTGNTGSPTGNTGSPTENAVPDGSKPPAAATPPAAPADPTAAPAPATDAGKSPANPSGAPDATGKGGGNGQAPPAPAGAPPGSG